MYNFIYSNKFFYYLAFNISVFGEISFIIIIVIYNNNYYGIILYCICYVYCLYYMYVCMYFFIT